MKSQKFVFSVLLLLIFIFPTKVSAQEQADKVIADAVTKAKKENKKVLLIYHASWCGWCKKMDKNLQNPEIAPIIDKNFVVTHLTVQESPNKKNLENPGAQKTFKKFGGTTDTGIPFFVILNSKGEMQANSMNEKGENLGCPATKEEVDVFIDKLKKTTKMNNSDLDKIREAFTEKK